MKSSLLGGGVAAASALFGGLVPAEAFGLDTASKYEGPVVETTAGKIRGVIQGGTHIFEEFLMALPPPAATASCLLASRIRGRECARLSRTDRPLRN